MERGKSKGKLEAKVDRAKKGKGKWERGRKREGK